MSVKSCKDWQGWIQVLQHCCQKAASFNAIRPALHSKQLVSKATSIFYHPITHLEGLLQEAQMQTLGLYIIAITQGGKMARA